MNTLQISKRADGVAVITIDMPDRSVNVFTPALVEDLEVAVEQILSDAEITGAVITSGKSSFIVGADLAQLVRVYGPDLTPAKASHYFDRENALMRRMENGGKTFACAINGMALGGGLELALACHYRVLSDDAKTLIGLPEVGVGLLPAGGGTQRLPRIIGVEAALPLLLKGQPIDALEALRMGVVSALAPRAGLVELAAQWVLRHPNAKQPWDVKGFAVPGGVGCLAPHAVNSFQYTTQQTKRAQAENYPASLAILSSVFEGTQLPFSSAMRVEAEYFGRLLASPVSRNLMRTMFMRKGEADKLARRPAGVPDSKVARLGIIGAGMMGSGIAYAAARSGINVVLLDANEEAALRGKDYSIKLLEKDIERGRCSREQADELLMRIRTGTDFKLLADADLVIEAVFENLAVKADVTARAEACMKTDAVMASNTSTLAITSLSANSQRPEYFIGMHFFSPVDKMPLVEVILGDKTSDATLARALDLVAQMKKTPIVVNDGPGFFTSRVYCTYVDEAMQMVSEGIAPALIENAAKLAGMPTGPLAVVDETALDLRWGVIRQAREQALDARFTHPPGVAVCERMVELGRLGRKTSAGFYDYPAGAKKHLWAGLSELFPLALQQPDVEEVRERLLAIQALEAVRCMDEGVLTSAQEGDLGSILGVGFPSWTGGALSYIDTVGVACFVSQCDALATRWGERFSPSKSLREKAALNQPLVATPGDH